MASGMADGRDVNGGVVGREVGREVGVATVSIVIINSLNRL